MKAVVAAFNQEKALVGAFSVIVQPVESICSTNLDPGDGGAPGDHAHLHLAIGQLEHWHLHMEQFVDMSDP